MKCFECPAYVDGKCIVNISDELRKTFTDGKVGCRFKSKAVNEFLNDIPTEIDFVQEELPLNEMMVSNSDEEINYETEPIRTNCYGKDLIGLKVRNVYTNKDYIVDSQSDDLKVVSTHTIDGNITMPVSDLYLVG